MRGRKTAHAEPFRVVQYATYPADSSTTHNVKYFEHFDDARTFYLHRCIDQIMDVRLLECVMFQRRNEHTGYYHTMFDSYQRHTVESYGLNPND